ncbi:TPA: restriction endonuclease subunit S [Clostridioides difficile]|nr:restriction endonuclease subunit S [Clostridioides difficile]
MKSNYKQLGQFIRQVDVRNTEGKEENLLGVSVQKKFMPSIANTVGTDFTKYKVVKKGQFTYIPDTSRRGDKIGIALLEDYEEGLVSNVYTVFEVIDEKQLIPQYLMLWFSRPEFDRYSRFKSHGSVREIMDWEEMCKVELPIPPYEKQLQIVESYKAITERIALKKQINDNLEATARAIYKKMFIEDVDLASLPNDWQITELGSVAELSAGGDRPTVYNDFQTDICQVPIFSNGIDKEGLYGYTDKAKIFDESVTVSARGTVGYVFLRDEPYVPIVRLISVIPNTKYVTAKYLYFALADIDLQSTGTSQQQITVPDFKKRLITVPNRASMCRFTEHIEPLFKTMKQNKAEILSLMALQTNYLALLSR